MPGLDWTQRISHIETFAGAAAVSRAEAQAVRVITGGVKSLKIPTKPEKVSFRRFLSHQPLGIPPNLKTCFSTSSVPGFIPIRRDDLALRWTRSMEVMNLTYSHLLASSMLCITLHASKRVLPQWQHPYAAPLYTCFLVWGVETLLIFSFQPRVKKPIKSRDNPYWISLGFKPQKLGLRERLWLGYFVALLPSWESVCGNYTFHNDKGNNIYNI